MMDRHPGLVLSRLIRQRGFWPRDISARSGVSHYDLMALFRAERTPSPRERVELARHLGCTPFGLKRLFAHYAGEFIEEWTSPHVIEPLPWELRSLEPERYDAVVMVHPDWDPLGPDRETLRRLAGAFARARSSGTPILVIKACRDPNPGLDELLADFGVTEPPLITRGSRRPRDRRRRSGREVRALAATLGLKPERVRLAFGGMLADACVQGVASRWCRCISTRWYDPDYGTPAGERPQRCFARGDLIDEILLLNGGESRTGSLALCDEADVETDGRAAAQTDATGPT
jgi:hypothetical protein